MNIIGSYAVNPISEDKPFFLGENREGSDGTDDPGVVGYPFSFLVYEGKPFVSLSDVEHGLVLGYAPDTKGIREWEGLGRVGKKR